MISRIEKSGINLELGEDVKKYIDRKIGRLDRYMPRSARKSVHVEAKLKATNNKPGNKYECEVILHLPGGKVMAKESTLNMFAAVDIVEAKLRNQLQRYKRTHSEHMRERRRTFFRRMRDRFLTRSQGDQ